MIYGPRISNTLHIKRGLVIYLPLCSSSTHNPAHSLRWLNGPQLPRQPPSAPSTEREGPWWADRHSPLKKREKKTREKQTVMCWKLTDKPLDMFFFLVWFRGDEQKQKKKKRWNTDLICIQWWKVRLLSTTLISIFCLYYFYSTTFIQQLQLLFRFYTQNTNKIWCIIINQPAAFLFGSSIWWWWIIW